MTKCKICNREVDTEGDWWCIACLNDYPADSDDVAEWAADRARKFERDRTNKLIETLELELETLGANAMKAMDEHREERGNSMDRNDSGRQNSVNHLIENPDQLRAGNIVDELKDLCAAVEAKDQGARAVLAGTTGEHLSEQESEQELCHDVQAEVELLRAHTWWAERAAVVAWIRKEGDYLYDAADRVERGEHWPEGGEYNGGSKKGKND